MFRSAVFSFNSMRSNSARLFRRSSLRGSIAAPVRRTFSALIFPYRSSLLKNVRLHAKNFPPAGKINAKKTAAMKMKLEANNAEFAAIAAMYNLYDILPFVKAFRIRDLHAKIAADIAEIQAEFAEIAAKNAANAPKDKSNMLLAEIAAMKAEHTAKIAEIFAKNAANEAKAKYAATVSRLWERLLLVACFSLTVLQQFNLKRLRKNKQKS